MQYIIKELEGVLKKQQHPPTHNLPTLHMENTGAKWQPKWQAMKTWWRILSRSTKKVSQPNDGTSCHNRNHVKELSSLKTFTPCLHAYLVLPLITHGEAKTFTTPFHYQQEYLLHSYTDPSVTLYSTSTLYLTFCLELENMMLGQGWGQVALRGYQACWQWLAQESQEWNKAARAASPNHLHLLLVLSLTFTQSI